MEIVTDFAHLVSVINLNRNCSQGIERRLRLGRAAMGELRKIFKGTEVALRVQAKTIHTLIFPINMYRCKSWTGKKAERKQLIHLKHGVGGELYGYPGPPER